MSGNQGLKVSSGVKTLLWSLVALVVSIGLAMLNDGGGPFPMIATLGFLGAVVGIGMVVIALVSKAGAAAGDALSLRRTPQRITVLASGGEVFDPGPVAPPDKDVPEVEGAWLSISRDLDRLQAHATLLDTHWKRARDHVNNAIRQFTLERQALKDQQRQILRWAFRGKEALRRIDGLQSIPLSMANLPQLQRLALPAAPTYLTPDQFGRKHGILPTNAGPAFARLAVTNGGLTNPANIGVAAVAVAVLAVRAKGTVSKARRAVTDAQGSIQGFCQDAAANVELLGRAHVEMVQVSARLKEIETEIEGLTDAVVAAATGGRTPLSLLSGPVQEKVRTLYYWTLAADQVSRQAPA